MMKQKNKSIDSLTLISEIERDIESLTRKLSPKEKQAERIKSVSEDLREGRKVTDFRFDQVYPTFARNLSDTHWTPVEVAIRAAELLECSSKTRILDVGSGCGKFCTVAALTSPGTFVGVEQRPHLIEIARTAATDLGAKRTSFIQGNMVDLDWDFFDSFYFFNPFYENKLKSIRIDDTVSFGLDKHSRYVEAVRTKLRSARVGTRVATYHGFGGDIPMGFRKVKKEQIGSDFLELWVKTEMIKSVLKKIE